MEKMYVINIYILFKGAREEEMIHNAMKEIERLSCVRFKPRTNEINFIRVEDKVKGVCNSDVGMQYKKSQYVNLDRNYCFNKLGDALHELLHALGAIHEQARPDRDYYIQVLTENIKEKGKIKELFFKM